MYSGINIDIVLPKRSSVYFLDRRAITSRYLSAAGDINAMKSSTSQCCFPNALLTSRSVFLEILSVVSSQLIFSNSSENIFSFFIQEHSAPDVLVFLLGERPFFEWESLLLFSYDVVIPPDYMFIMKLCMFRRSMVHRRSISGSPYPQISCNTCDASTLPTTAGVTPTTCLPGWGIVSVSCSLG